MTQSIRNSILMIEENSKKYIDQHIEVNRLFSLVDSQLEHYYNFQNKHVGKVRDIFILNDYVIIVTTDRQSAFNRIITSIPFKGQVLNMTSKWWFDATKHLVPNHFISCPHPNVTIAKKCKIFPIEFIMRGYLTGSTDTSIWTHYKNGERIYCGHTLPDGLIKNCKLESNLLTPTTKDDHDVPISKDEIISKGIMSEKDFQICSQYAHKLFEFGVEESAKKGLILVDTKYEFGKDKFGNILLVDEIQTPDSTRFWIKNSYQDRFSKNLEPENIDKDFFRKWFLNICDPYNDAIIPHPPSEIINELSRKYIILYEIITGNNFNFSISSNSDSIKSAVKDFLHKNNINPLQIV